MLLLSGWPEDDRHQRSKHISIKL